MPGFNGMRVLSVESRRAQEIAHLIRSNGGVPIVAPSTREQEIANSEVEQIVNRILAGEFHAIILMTGVGSRALLHAAERICARTEFIAALLRARIIVRGPKPAAVARELNLTITLSVPEPNTWREIVTALDQNPDRVPVKDQHILIQEHGEPSTELSEALRDRGAQISTVQVYRSELPEDISPLKSAISEVAAKKIDVVLFTSSVQFTHAFRIAKEMGLSDSFLGGLQHAMVASIGPVCSETLRKNGVRVDFEPSHPRMGFLVKEAAEKAVQSH
ncbi:MAG TPA: uroporphyrinogen-III synthase [Terriglobales bacterium]|nr:uroporphyrinogen-III synthase [Terriglobales bacterium]